MFRFEYLFKKMDFNSSLKAMNKLLSNYSLIKNNTEMDDEYYVNVHSNFYLFFRKLFLWINFVIDLIGLTGNVISFIVLINPKMRTTTNIYLSNLCISSFISLFGLLINSILYEISFYYHLNRIHSIIQYIYPYVYPIVNTFQMASILLTVCVSFNQFICVYLNKAKCFSKVSLKKEQKKALKVSLFVYIFSTIYCIPYWLKFEYKNGLQVTKIGKIEKFNKIVNFWIYLPCVYIIPFSILIVTNFYLLLKLIIYKNRRSKLGFIFKKNENNLKALDKINDLNCEINDCENNDLKTNLNNLIISNVNKSNGKLNIRFIVPYEKSEKWFKKYKITSCKLKFSKQSKRDDTKIENEVNKNGILRAGRTTITCMLIAVVFFFFMCQFPNLVMHILTAINHKDSNYDNEYDSNPYFSSKFYNYGIVISKFLLFVNLSFNFSFYCFFSEQFRNVFWETYLGPERTLS